MAWSGRCSLPGGLGGDGTAVSAAPAPADRRTRRGGRRGPDRRRAGAQLRRGDRRGLAGSCSPRPTRSGARRSLRLHQRPGRPARADRGARALRRRGHRSRPSRASPASRARRRPARRARRRRPLAVAVRGPPAGQAGARSRAARGRRGRRPVEAGLPALPTSSGSTRASSRRPPAGRWSNADGGWSAWRWPASTRRGADHPGETVTRAARQARTTGDRGTSAGATTTAARPRCTRTRAPHAGLSPSTPHRRARPGDAADPHGGGSDGTEPAAPPPAASAPGSHWRLRARRDRLAARGAPDRARRWSAAHAHGAAAPTRRRPRGRAAPGGRRDRRPTVWVASGRDDRIVALDADALKDRPSARRRAPRRCGWRRRRLGVDGQRRRRHRHAAQPAAHRRRGRRIPIGADAVDVAVSARRRVGHQRLARDRDPDRLGLQRGARAAGAHGRFPTAIAGAATSCGS